MNIGEPVAATDTDTLTYSLGADGAASFDINASSGQLQTKAALDHETDAEYYVYVTATDTAGGTDTIFVIITVNDVEEPGTVTLSSQQPLVAIPLTATLDDLDVVVSGSLTWSWARSPDGTSSWNPISGETSASYTPVAGDVGDYLRATASYTDGEAAGKSAQAISAHAVELAPGRNKPVFTEGLTATRSIPRNTPAGVFLGAPFTATDADNDLLTYSLGGPDEAGFDLNTSSGQLLTRDVLTGIQRTSYEVVVSVSDGKNDLGMPEADSQIDATTEVTINVGGVDSSAKATGAPVISGQPEVGETLMADTTGIMDADGLTSVSYAYQWVRVASGAQETDIVGATSAAYTVTQGDVGVALKVKTTFNDEKGNRESLTSASTVLVIVAQVKVSFGAAAYAAAEGGPAVTVTVVLDKDPHRTVTIPLTATPEGGTGSGDYTAPTEVVFNAGATTKDVTVMAVDDTVDDDGESVVLTFGILPDGVSAGTTARALVQITDNDGPGVVLSPTSLTVPEGGSATYTVALASEPTADVTVTITGHAGTDLTLTPTTAMMTFTPSTWNTAQTVMLSAAPDSDANNDSVTLTHTASDGGYTGVTAALAVTVTDDDDMATPTATVTPPTRSSGGGGGGRSRSRATPTPTPSPTPMATPTPTGPQFSGVIAAEPSVTATVVPEGTTLGLNGGGDLPGGVYVNFPPTAVALPVPVSVSVSNTAPDDVEAPSGTTLLPLTINITPETPLILGEPLTIEINPTPELLEAAGGDLNQLAVGVVTPHGVVVLPAQVLHGRLVVTTDRIAPFVLLAVTDTSPVLTQLPMDDASFMGPLLKWTQPPGTTWFQVQVIPFNEDGPGINLVIGDGALVQAAQYQVLGPNFGSADPNYVMLPGMTYLWRVRTSTVLTNPTAADWSAWAVSSFKTPPASSSTITRVAPPYFGEVRTLTPTLTWANSNTAVFYYEVQVSRDYEFGPNAFLYSEYVHGGASTPANSYVVPEAFPLEAGEIYYWRVRPRIQGDGDPLPWSRTYVFQAPG